MTYESMTGLGAPQGAFQLIDGGPPQDGAWLQSWHSGGWNPTMLTGATRATRGTASRRTLASVQEEIRGTTGPLNALVDRVRAGSAGALQELQEAMRHHDIVEEMGVQTVPAHLSQAGFTQAMWQQFQDTLATAQAVASGNDPQAQPPEGEPGEDDDTDSGNGERSYVVPVAIGVGALLIGGLAFALVAKRR